MPAIETVGGKAVFAQLKFPDYAPDWAQVKSLINERTRMIVVNSPHNPTGSLLTAADLDRLADLVRGTDIVILSDEVYEHILFDGERHASLCGHRELAARSIVVSSFGKTYHITGWKIGYVVGPAALMAGVPQGASVQRVHRACAVATGDCRVHAGRRAPSPPGGLLSGKARFFRQLMAATPFDLLPCRGTYFQLARYDRISDLPDRAFAEWMTREVGVAVIPVSVFMPTAATTRSSASVSPSARKRCRPLPSGFVKHCEET